MSRAFGLSLYIHLLKMGRHRETVRLCTYSIQSSQNTRVRPNSRSAQSSNMENVMETIDRGKAWHQEARLGSGLLLASSIPSL